MSRLVHSMRVKDSAGSEVRLYEFEYIEEAQLLGFVPFRRKVRRLKLDTGEAVERTSRRNEFIVSETGERLVRIDRS